jgi:Cys-tRNA(Pro)/Cys-tRNA(Cys) deacylase
MSPLIRDWLAAHGLDHRLHRHEALKSFEDLSAALNFSPAAMVKALAFVDPSGRIILTAMPGAAKADYKRIADAACISRAQLRAATPDELSEKLDAEAGGVGPFALNGSLLLIDAGVTALDRIYCGTGRVGSTLEIDGPGYLAAAGGIVGAFTKA